MTIPAAGEAIAERLCAWAQGLVAEELPDAVKAIAARQLVDLAGLCLAARHSDYVAAILEACQDTGPCTLIGHPATRSATVAALVNGTAAHGEDFDDTFEGTPVHAGAVVVPAVLASCESYHRSGGDALKGIAAGVELMCRTALVTPGAIHRAGFHPTAVIGALGAALGAGVAMGLSAKALSSALGVAGSLAGGIIEYLAEGTWTKRLHAGWAAQSGVHAARLARAGFLGPRTVLDGQHGFFHAFTNGDLAPDFGALSDDLGTRWLMEGIAFKPYACGTMAQPFIDCALALRETGIDPDNIVSIECKVGEGTVHRLWEPLADKRRPASPYGAKFSVPFCIAAGILDGAAGLAQFTDERIRDGKMLALASRIGYRIDPADEYPANYSGHMQVALKDGARHEFHQAHLRGGKYEPLSDAELFAKYQANARLAGWNDEQATRARITLTNLFAGDDLSQLAELRT